MPWDIEQAIRLDAQLLANVEDMSPAMAVSRDILVRAIEKNFETESAAGDPWEELKPSTIEDRHRKGFEDGPILHRTGDLQAAATAHREYGADYVEVGLQDDHPYGKYHVSSEPRSIIPLRDFLAVGEEDIDAMGDAIVEHIERNA